MPTYKTPGSAGLDLRAANTGMMRPGDVQLIPCGFKIQLPIGYEAQVRPRSGIALEWQVTVLNSPGTIDSDYRGEVYAMLINLGRKDFYWAAGDRIAQLVIAPVAMATVHEVVTLDETSRGEGGFGSTGIK